MQTTTNPQLGLLDALMASAPSNQFLERLNNLLDWEPIEVALWSMYPAKTGRPPHPPLVLFKMCLLQHCYNLSDPQCEELLCDRISWRKFCGLGLQDPVPDDTTGEVDGGARARQPGVQGVGAGGRTDGGGRQGVLEPGAL